MNDCTDVFDGCTRCDGADVCEEFEECPTSAGFHLEGQFCARDQQCADESSTCAACMVENALSCAKCAENAYTADKLDDGSLICQRCHAACAACSGPGRALCLECAPGYQLMEYSGRTECFPSNCAAIAADGSCTACEQGFLKLNQRCIACDSACSACEGKADLCTACADGFQIANNARGFPQRCFARNELCWQFDFQGLCIVCAQGYAVNSKHRCLASAGLPCGALEDCQDDLVCQNGECQRCPLPSFYSHGQCGTCSPGSGIKYTSRGGIECTPCSSEKCENCLEDASSCSECKPNYHMREGFCVYTFPDGAVVGVCVSVLISAAIAAAIIARVVIRRMRGQKPVLPQNQHLHGDTVENGAPATRKSPEEQENGRESNASIEPALK